MINLSISFNKGRGNLEHNRRELAYELSNVDRNKSSNNIALLDDDIHETYTKLFGDAVEEHDKKASRKCRKIVDYYDYVKRREDKINSQSTKQQARLFKEFVVQIGSRDTLNKNKITDDMLILMYQKYYDDFKKRHPNLHVFGAYIHLDELTPHLHLDIIPCSETSNSRATMKLTNSFDNALEKEGYNVKNQRTAFRKWRIDETNSLEKILEEFNIGREIVGNTNAHSTNAHLDLHQKYTTQVNIFVDEQSKKVAKATEKMQSFKAKKKVGAFKTEEIDVVEKSVFDELLKENQALQIQKEQSKKSLIDKERIIKTLTNEDLKSELEKLKTEKESLEKVANESESNENKAIAFYNLINKLVKFETEYFTTSIDDLIESNLFADYEITFIKQLLKTKEYQKENMEDWEND